MIKCNVSIEIRHPNGRVSFHRAHNTVTQAGLNFMAKLLAGESDPNNFSQVWSIYVDVANSTSVVGSVEFANNLATITAQYTPVTAVTWAGRTLALDVGNVSPVRFATAGPDDFNPVLETTTANSQITFRWAVSIGHSGNRTPATPGIIGGSPYIPSQHEAAITTAMMNTLRNAVGQTDMSESTLVWYRLSQEPDDGMPDPPDQDLEDGGTVTIDSITRVANVLTFMWDMPSATEASEGFRERVIVPTWATNPWSAHRIDLPRGVAGETTQITIPLTVGLAVI